MRRVFCLFLFFFIYIVSYGQAKRILYNDTISNTSGANYISEYVYYNSFSVNAGTNQSPCLCDTIQLAGTSTGTDAVKWLATYPDGSAATGTYSDQYSLTSEYYPGSGDCDSTLTFTLVGYNELLDSTQDFMNVIWINCEDNDNILPTILPFILEY